MPLKSGSDIQTIQGNISKLIEEYKVTGRIGSVTPKSLTHAQQIATAIANKQKGVTKKMAAV